MSLGLPGTGAAQDRQPPRHALTLAIAAPIAEVGVGAPVPLKLAVTNVPDHKVHFSDSNVSGLVFKNQRLRQIDIQVRDADGNLVAETEYGKTIQGRSVERPPAKPTSSALPLRPMGPGRHDTYSVLAPGKTFTEESDLSKEFDLGKPGTYTVQAMTRSGDPDAAGPVESNGVTFTITK
jgi:hypothetical protein